VKLSISRRAQKNLDDIWFYLASESGSAETADKVVDSLHEAFGMLRRSPRIGRSREFDLRPGWRSYPVGHYLIFYRAGSGTVRILSVLHGMRNIPAVLRNR
jgi:toxin ParE1/3/4